MADALSDTYIQNTGLNRSKSELEKLIIWKLHGFNGKFLYWLINTRIKWIGKMIELNWLPPLTIYHMKELGNPNKTNFIRDTGDGYEITENGVKKSYKI